MILRVVDISSKEHGEHHALLPPGVTLAQLFEQDARLRAVEKHIARVTVNGIERKNWKAVSPGKNDRVSVEILPADIGLGALVQIFQIITAITSVVRFIISLFAQPQKPKTPGADKSQTYTFEGIRDNFPPGDPVPIVYGRQRKGGQVLMYQVTMDADKKHQRLKMLLGMCEGVVSSIGAIEVNNSGIENFDSFSYTVLVGTSSQGPIQNFTEIANTFYDGREITNYNTNKQHSLSAIVFRTANNNVTDIELQVRAPGGLYTIGKHKGTVYPQWSSYLVEIKRSEHLFWTVVATRILRALGKGPAAQRPVWDIFKFGLPTPHEYDVRLTWLKSSANPWANHPVGFDYRLELYNYTEFAGTMPVYSSTALLAIHGTATQEIQGGQPTVTAIVHGKEMKRYYAVDSFDIGWSNNPAWAVRDYLTNSVYGMGAYITEADLDMQSFLDFATLANSDVEKCVSSAPDPYDMAFGQVFCDKTADTAIEGDQINGGGVFVPFDNAVPIATFKMASREDGKPRAGICYTHHCCPPYPPDRDAFGGSAFGVSSPDLLCNYASARMHFRGVLAGHPVGGLLCYIRSGSSLRDFTGYGAIYDTTGNTPCISLQRWKHMDARTFGTILASVSAVLPYSGDFLLTTDPESFSVASGFVATLCEVYVEDSLYISHVDGADRVEHNGDALTGVIVLPSFGAEPNAAMQWGEWYSDCENCYSDADIIDFTCYRNFRSTP